MTRVESGHDEDRGGQQPSKPDRQKRGPALCRGVRRAPVGLRGPVHFVMGGPTHGALATFRLYAPDVHPLYEIRVVGEIETLGSWQPDNGKKTTRLLHGWFEAVVHLPHHVNGEVQYKYVLATPDTDEHPPAFMWEYGSNRVLFCGACSHNYAVDTFGDTSSPERPNGQEEVETRVMSFNIRYDNPNDGLHRWALRKAYVAQLIRVQKPLVLGLQEVLHQQLEYLASSLASDYSWIGVGRDDGHQAGEYSPIFYNHNQVKLLDFGNFWLSEAPWSPGSTSWGSACVRICTWGKFQLSEYPKSRPFFVFNTHLDHQSKLAREEGLKLINTFFHAWSGSCQGLIMGDFNETPDHSPITTILSPKAAFPGYLENAKDMSVEPALGPTDVTFPDWDGSGKICIDYILVKPFMKVKCFSVIEQKANGLPISDHYPVVADLLLHVSQK